VEGGQQDLPCKRGRGKRLKQLRRNNRANYRSSTVNQAETRRPIAWRALKAPIGATMAPLMMPRCVHNYIIFRNSSDEESRRILSPTYATAYVVLHKHRCTLRSSPTLLRFSHALWDTCNNDQESLHPSLPYICLALSRVSQLAHPVFFYFCFQVSVQEFQYARGTGASLTMVSHKAMYSVSFYPPCYPR